METDGPLAVVFRDVGIKFRDVMDLASAGSSNPEEQLLQLYQWRYDHLSVAAKAITGTGATTLIAIVAASYQHKSSSSYIPLVIGAVASLIVITIGIYRYSVTERVYREFLAANELLTKANRIGPFLRLARSQ